MWQVCGGRETAARLQEKHSKQRAIFEVALRNAAVIGRIAPVGFVAK
jgi:hypothetical protein